MSSETQQSKADAHRAAEKRNARNLLSRGDELSVVVWKTSEEVGGECSMTKIENIKTFIHPGPYTLEYGDTVDIKILDVGDNHAEALTVETG